jgi:hypothetical protein
MNGWFRPADARGQPTSGQHRRTNRWTYNGKQFDRPDRPLTGGHRPLVRLMFQPAGDGT